MFGLHFAGWNGSLDVPWYITTALYLASYPLLMMKTASQVLGSPLSFADSAAFQKINWNAKGAWAGFLPFALLNTFFIYQLPALWGESKKNEVLQEIIDTSPIKKGKGIKKNEYWH